MAVKIELLNSFLASHPNLYSYYRMEGNSNDTKGNVNGSDTAMSYAIANGLFGQGASFNGTTSFISLGTSKFDFTTLTIAFQLVNKGTDKVLEIIARNPNADQWPNLGIGYEGSRMFAVCGGTGQTVETYANVTSGSFYVFSFNNTDLRVYKDGVFLVNLTMPSSPNNNITNSMSIGRSGAYNNYYFDGKLDELSIWNIALTEAEQLELYNGYRAEKYLKAQRRSRELGLISNKYAL